MIHLKSYFENQIVISYPELFGNEAFVNLKRVAERGHWLDSEEWMYKKWRSYVARHQRDYRVSAHRFGRNKKELSHLSCRAI